MRSPVILAMLLVTALPGARAVAQAADDRRYDIRDDIPVMLIDEARIEE